VSRLDLVVGPNGAGKSTFIRLTVTTRWAAAHVVNADDIAARTWPDDPGAHAYDAAALAARTRARLVATHQPFVAETVCSHPSKLELVHDAKHAGFYVALHALMVPVELAVARVRARVAAGGHDVPEAKIRSRYDRLWDVVADAILLCDSATCWDNARRDGPIEVATFIDGIEVYAPHWPAWTPAALRTRWAPAAVDPRA
jgi:predicted ABC-type ATPase